jgi:hypothetical protein
MTRRAGSIGIMLATLVLLGAGEGSPYEKALQQMIGALDAIGTTLKTVVDEESAMASKPSLRKSNDIWVETRAKAAKLEPPERDEKTRLEKLYKPKLEEAMKKMFTEIRRVENIPGGKDALKEIAGVLKKDGK